MRRSYSRRHYRLTNNPQDYLDYISDNDLTPLASSELAASLEERPPSYRESEEMKNNSETESSRDSRVRQNGGRIIESVLRRSLNLSSSLLRQNPSDESNTDRESSERDNRGPPDPQMLRLPQQTTDNIAIHDCNTPGCLSNERTPSGANVPDLNTHNGNGTQGHSSEPIPQSEPNHETPVGMLIDLT